MTKETLGADDGAPESDARLDASSMRELPLQPGGVTDADERAMLVLIARCEELLRKRGAQETEGGSPERLEERLTEVSERAVRGMRVEDLIRSAYAEAAGTEREGDIPAASRQYEDLAARAREILLQKLEGREDSVYEAALDDLLNGEKYGTSGKLRYALKITQLLLGDHVRAKNPQRYRRYCRAVHDRV